MASNLTSRQIAFAREYLIDGNASAAAVRAGYSKHAANVQGSQLLRNPKIRALINGSNILSPPPGSAVKRIAKQEVLSMATEVKDHLAKFAFKHHEDEDIRPEHSIKALDSLAKIEGLYQEANTGMQMFQIAIHLNADSTEVNSDG